jgi:F-type H+-transporting ATPase subunit a
MSRSHSLVAFLLTALFLAGGPLCGPLAAAPEAAVEAAGDHGAAVFHGLPEAAPVLKDFGWFQISNSMVATWVVALLLILVAQLATRKVKVVPSGLQNFVEWVVEGLQGFLEGILGRELAARTFWFFATVFLFIISANWMGLLPGVGSIGWGTPKEEGGFLLKSISEPLLRGANADLNMTLGIALVFMFAWIVWSIQANGLGGFIKHIFWPAEGKMGMGLVALLALPFIFAGLLELVSIAFRPVSLSFRLYGNIFAGENLLESMLLISPKFGWLAALPFYFMELLVGAVQALVFMLLTAVFTVLMCGHGDHAEHGHAGHDHPPGDGH